jgi:hypothetical protein
MMILVGKRLSISITLVEKQIIHMQVYKTFWNLSLKSCQKMQIEDFLLLKWDFSLCGTKTRVKKRNKS